VVRIEVGECGRTRGAKGAMRGRGQTASGGGKFISRFEKKSRSERGAFRARA